MIVNNEADNLTLETLDGQERPYSQRPVRRVVNWRQKQLNNNLQGVKDAVLPPANPTVVNPTGQGGVPKALLSCSATESPSKQQDRTFSEVSINFTRDASDTFFASVDIWFTGYKGNTSPTLMASCTASPFSFLCETTKEVVTVSLQPVGVNGETAPLDWAITTTVLLDGVISAPPSPNVSQTVISTPTGFQFAFDEIVLGGGTQDVIDSYRVYRNTTNNSGTASVVRTFTHSPTNSGSIVVQDEMEQYQTRFYWVSAVNTSGLESVLAFAGTGVSGAVSQGGAGSNLVFNGDFSIATIPTGTANSLESAARVAVGSTVNPNGWTQFFENQGADGAMYQFVSSSGGLGGVPRTNWMVLQNAVGVSQGYSAISDAFPVKPGAVYTYSAYIFTNIGVPTGANWYFRILWYKAGTTDFSRFSATLATDVSNGAKETDPGIFDIAAGRTDSFSGVITKNLLTPADAAYCRIAFYHWSTISVTTQWNLCVSDVQCRQLTGSIGLTGLNNNYTWLTTGILSNTGGSTVITVAAATAQFGFGQVSYSGGSVDPGAYGGPYYVYCVDPGYNGGSQTLFATTSFATVNSLDWVIFFGEITTAAGGGGTSGGGGSGGTGETCFSGNTRLADGRTFESVRAGDLVLVEKDNGKRVHRTVKKVFIIPYDGPAFDMGDGELVTPEHPFRHNGHWVEACRMFTDRRPFNGLIYHLEIDTTEADEHNFVLANGLCAHNRSTL